MAEQKIHLGAYFPGLHGLRGLMAMGIIVAHVNQEWFPGAAIIMDMFFVISGFLITSIMLREIEKSGSIALFRFWGRRLQRLYPALLAVVVLTLPVAWLLSENFKAISQDALSSVLYYSNWTKIYEYIYPSMYGHTWSLSVEEQFYLLWPLIFFLSLAARLRIKQILMLLMLISLASLAWRHHLIDSGAPWSRIYYALETRMDAFVAGGILAICFIRLHEKLDGRIGHAVLNLCTLALVILLCVGRPREIEYFYWQQSLALILSAAIILQATSLREGLIKRLFCSRPCVYLGERCYSLYLWHWPIIWLLLTETQATKTTILMITVALTLFLSSLTYRFVEIVFLPKPSYQQQAMGQLTLKVAK